MTRMKYAKTLFALTWLTAVSAQATVFDLNENTPEVFGVDEHIQATYEDTLVDIGRRYSIGYEEITRVNKGIDPWLPGAGTQVLIPGRRILPPGPREGIVVNLPEHRLYYFPKPKKKGDKRVVITYPVSIGKMDWSTPMGETRVTQKTKNPSWRPPESVRKEHAARGESLPAVVPPGPDNPLGAFSMRLAITPGAYLIHGTNNPLAVGMAITHGCIRMFPEDIEALFPLVPVGTKVTLINEPVKVAYVDGELLLEAHPPVDAQGQAYEPNLQVFSQLLDRALGSNTAAVNWDIAQETLQTANGMPATVGIEALLDGDPSQPLPPGSVPAVPAPAAAVTMKPLEMPSEDLPVTEMPASETAVESSAPVGTPSASNPRD